ncbi:MAG: PKD domain-containing protein [Candidatus Acetothermia bacterium]
MNKSGFPTVTRLALFTLLTFIPSFLLLGCSPFNQPPQPLFTASPASGEAPLEVSFDASSSSDPDNRIIGYNWDFGDGVTGSGETTTHTYDSSGDYTAELEVVDEGEGAESTTRTIEVSPAPPSAIFTANPTSGEEPLNVSFDASESYDPDGTIKSYHWDFNDGSTASALRVSHTFLNSGSYVVELIVTDNDGKTDSMKKTINVSSFSNQSPTAGFTAQPTIGKPPLYVSFDASESYDPDGYVKNYEWDYDDGSTDYGVSPGHTFTAAGRYTVELTVTDNYGKEDTASASIDVLNQLVTILDWELVRGSSGEAVVEGSLKNVTSETIENCTVMVNFYCPRGNNIGGNLVRVDDIQPGATDTFLISSSLYYEEVARVEFSTEVEF